MTDSEKLDIILIRQSAILDLLPVVVSFIAASASKEPGVQWNKSIKEYEKIIKAYNKILDENHNNITGKSDSVS